MRDGRLGLITVCCFHHTMGSFMGRRILQSASFLMTKPAEGYLDKVRDGKFD